MIAKEQQSMGDGKKAESIGQDQREPNHICPRCGSKTIAWEQFEAGKKREGRKCFSCGEFRKTENKKEASKIAGEEKVEMVDQNGAGEEGKRLCKDCGEKPTMSAKCPYCASCMRKKSIEARAAKVGKVQKDNKAPAAGKAKIGIKPPALPKTPAKTKMAVVQVDFGGYSQIFEGVKKLAEEEIRPVELQIIYLLKSALGRHKEPLKVA